MKIENHKLVQTLTGYNKNTDMMIIAGNILAGCSCGWSISEWNINTSTCLQKSLQSNYECIAYHDGLIWAAIGEYIVAKFYDDDEIAWMDLPGHTKKVNSMVSYGGLLWSASADHTIRQWDATTGACVRILTGHTAPVVCIIAHRDRLWSCSDDHTIRQWDPNTGQNTHTINHHSCYVTSIVACENILWSCSDDGTYRAYNIDTNTSMGLWTRTNYTHMKQSMSISNNVLTMVIDKHTLHQCNALTGEPITTIKTNFQIFSILSHQTVVYIGAKKKIYGYRLNLLKDIRANYDMFSAVEQRYICEVFWLLLKYIPAELAQEVIPYMDQAQRIK